ncbi:MAG: hypothetical protein R3E98_08590 [Gemmatimonadota bacterium]|nr:hypothetical protein [Gemmatimonadota bacterium]
MNALSQALTYGRFLRGFPDYLRGRITLPQARDAVRARLARRPEHLLAMAERYFYGLPQSPYRALLELAGCTLADFEALIRTEGVEGALLQLRRAGVYVTFEEYKGREPLVRDGREIPVSEGLFDNPDLRHYYRNSTSGSTGRATRSSTDLAHLEVQSELRMLLLDAHGVLDVPFSVWRPALPSGSGLNNVLRMARLGRPVHRWFTPLVPGEYAPALKYRIATEAAIATGRAVGVDLVRPEPVPLDRALLIARYLTETVREHGGACLSTTVSCGLRIAVAARDAGLDLSGATLLVAGEPATPAKVRGMRASGATVVSDYGAVETGRIALGCARPAHETDMHVTTDSAALVLHPRTVPGSEETVRSIHITTLVPTMPKLLLNMELDDFGEMEERACGCALGELGLGTHLRSVRSFRKLVGEGVTLIGSDMVHILEEILPARFGGSPLDYQLVEDEDDRGFTRLSLHVHPQVALRSEGEVLDVVLDALARTSVAADMARAYWAAAGSFRVVRRAPTVSARGKQAPLRVVRGGQAA